MATLGERIRILREAAGMTQEEFGKLIGVVKSTVCLYESGKSTPNDQIKTRICQHFDVSLDYLLGLTDKPNCSTIDNSDVLILSTLETTLIHRFRNLNQEGQEKVLAYLDDLNRAGIYKNDYQPDMVQKQA